MDAADYLRGHPRACRDLTAVRRRCAYAVVRRVFEDGAYADRAFRAEAQRLGLDGRDRAFAMRLAYGDGAAPAHARPRDRAALGSPAGAARPAGARRAAARRSTSSLFMDGVADHAAVSECVDLAKARRQPRARPRQRRAAPRRARGARPLLDELADATPPEAALLHSHPDWVARAVVGGSSGADDARAPDGARQRARRERGARQHAAHDRAEVVERARAGRRRGRRRRRSSPRRVVLTRPFDLHGSPLFERGALMPQSRASMLVARAVDPQPGRARARPVRRAGRQDDAPRGADGRRGRGRRGRARPRSARASVAAQLPSASARACVEVVVGDAAEPAFGSGFDRVLVDPPCSDLGTLQSRPDARWRKTRSRWRSWPRSRRRILDAGGAGAAAGRPARVLHLHDQPGRERAPDRSAAGRSAEFRPRSRARPAGSFRLCPHRDRTDGFFIATLREGHERHTGQRAADARRERDVRAGPAVPELRRAVAAPDAARRAATAASTACVRFQLMAYCPTCGEHSTIVRMSDSQDLVCVQLRRVDAEAGIGSGRC